MTLPGARRSAHAIAYAAAPAPALRPPGKRGPKTRVSDGDLVEEIRAGHVSVSWRRLSQGARAPRPSRPGGQWQARAPADAHARAAGPAAPGTPEWQPGPRRDDHHGSTRRDVGDRCDALLYRA